MKIVELVWEEWHVEHIVSRYSVRPSEIEEACFEDESIRVLGKTLRDRYLHIVIKPTGKGKAKVITARDMNGSEKRLYKGVK